jgi:glutamate-1-semialdehyde 2,1-aminomutase
MGLGAADLALRERARRVIPSGLWGHMNAAGVGPTYPQYFASGEGALVWDADGRRYIDFMCGWGPIILGRGHPAVEEAAARQHAKGDLLNGPAPILVELAEALVELMPFADWVMFQKNGTDATTLAVTLARAAEGRRKILLAKGAYHGAAPWCSPSAAGVSSEDRAHLIYFDYNDTASLEAAADAAGSDLAGVLVSAFKHDYGVDQALPTQAFANAARAICDRTGAALILDDVRAGLRIDLRGSWAPLGVTPDLAAFSKAVANGYALSFVAGCDRYRDAAKPGQVYATGSFWCGAVAMAAALATVQTLKSYDAVGHMRAMGERLREGLSRLAAAEGLSVRQTGPAQMPLMLFDDDNDFKKGAAFCAGALERGAYFHPRHNMFLSAAHTPALIDEALEAAAAGMSAAARA